MTRRLLLFISLICLCAPCGAQAQEADSTRWSLGAGLVNDRGEAFLGYRVRPTVDALFLVRIGLRTGGQSSQGDWGVFGVPSPSRNSNPSFDIAIGPGLRRFSRAGKGLRAYGSVLTTASFCGQEYTVNTLTGLKYKTRTFGVGMDWLLGAEYLSPWSMSLAVDTSIASVEWDQSRMTTNQGTGTGGPPVVDSWNLNFKSSLSPRLLVRAYF